VRSHEPFRKQFRVYKRSCFRFRLFACVLARIIDASSKWGAKVPTETGTSLLPVGLFARWPSGTRTSRILTLIYILGYTSIYRGGRETGPVLHTGPPARVVSPFAGITQWGIADPEKQERTERTPIVARDSVVRDRFGPRKRTQHPSNANGA